MRRLALALLLFLAAPVAAEDVVASLSSNEVAITTNFNGSEILIFGAVRREAPIPLDAPLEVIITVEGPSRPVVVRRKDRVLGIWANTEMVDVAAAPTFYAVSTTSPFEEVLSDANDQRHRISVPRAIRAVSSGVEDQSAFIEALIRIRQDEDLYQYNEDAVTLRQSTLFDTAVQLPANLVEGDYRMRIFLTRSGEVISQLESDISVRKVGLERLTYNLAQNQPLLYGILSLLIAIAAGWLASAAFRLIRT